MWARTMTDRPPVSYPTVRCAATHVCVTPQRQWFVHLRSVFLIAGRGLTRGTDVEWTGGRNRSNERATFWVWRGGWVGEERCPSQNLSPFRRILLLSKCRSRRRSRRVRGRARGPTWWCPLLPYRWRWAGLCACSKTISDSQWYRRRRCRPPRFRGDDDDTDAATSRYDCTTPNCALYSAPSPVAAQSRLRIPPPEGAVIIFVTFPWFINCYIHHKNPNQMDTVSFQLRSRASYFFFKLQEIPTHLPKEHKIKSPFLAL